MIHKRAARPQTEGLFIGAFERLHPEYRKIQLELVRIDTFSSAFPLRSPPVPARRHHHSLCNILSNQTSGLARGVGVAPSLNAGSEHAMARVVHAAAPDIAKKGNGQPLGIDPVDGTAAELVLPEDQD